MKKVMGKFIAWWAVGFGVVWFTRDSYYNNIYSILLLESELQMKIEPNFFLQEIRVPLE